jgi:hypothetical protein
VPVLQTSLQETHHRDFFPEVVGDEDNALHDESKECGGHRRPGIRASEEEKSQDDCRRGQDD